LFALNYTVPPNQTKLIDASHHLHARHIGPSGLVMSVHVSQPCEGMDGLNEALSDKTRPVGDKPASAEVVKTARDGMTHRPPHPSPNHKCRAVLGKCEAWRVKGVWVRDH